LIAGNCKANFLLYICHRTLKHKAAQFNVLMAISDRLLIAVENLLIDSYRLRGIRGKLNALVLITLWAYYPEVKGLGTGAILAL